MKSQQNSATLTTSEGIDLRIGGQEKNGGGQWWNGKIDEVGLWNRALSHEEISFLYSGTQADEYDITFQVDMSNEMVSEEGVFIAGSFNDFDPTANILSDMGNGVFQTTLTLPTNEHVTYRFCNGSLISNAELVPQDCGEDNGSGIFNRYLNVSFNSIRPLVCFGTCETCVSLTEMVAYYPFSGNTADESGNDYHGTNYGATLVTDRFGNENEAYYFNGTNSYIHLPTPNVGQNDGMGTWACWFRTQNDFSPEHAQLLDIFHAGGMHLAEGKAGGGMEIGYGDQNHVNDNLYQVNDDNWHFIVLSYNNLNLKLFVDGELRDQVTDGVGQIDYNGLFGIYLGMQGLNINHFLGYLDDVRIYDRPLSQEEITDLYFENTTIPDEFDITFQVDMSNEIVSGEGVFIAGSFNGHNPADTPMTDMGNGIYKITLSLPAFDQITFQYCNGSSFENAEIVPEDCGEDNGSGVFMRTLELYHNSTLPTVCFGSCEQCVSLTEMVAYYPFNGNTSDESGNDYHGTNYGATLATDRFGNENQAYYFNGSSNYIHIPTPNVGQSDGMGTWACWFKVESAAIHFSSFC